MHSPDGSRRPSGGHFRLQLHPTLRDYLVSLALDAPPGPARASVLEALGHVDDAWETAPQPVDWDELESEARRQQCTVADVIYDRAAPVSRSDGVRER